MLGWEALSRHSLGTSWMSWCYPFVCACFCPAQGRMTVLQPLLGSNSQQMDWKREVKQIQVYSAGTLLIHLYCSVNVQSWIGTVTLAETAGLSHIVNNKLIFLNSDPPQGSDLTVEVSAWVTAKTVSPVFYCFLQAQSDARLSTDGAGSSSKRRGRRAGPTISCIFYLLP